MKGRHNLHQGILQEVGPRVREPPKRRTRSVEHLVEQFGSRLDSSASVHTEGQSFVTKEAFDDKLGKIEKTLQKLLEKQDKSAPEGKSSSERSSPPETIEGGHSKSTPSVMMIAKEEQGCSYKEFSACRPPTFKGERDPVKELNG